MLLHVKHRDIISISNVKNLSKEKKSSVDTEVGNREMSF